MKTDLARLRRVSSVCVLLLVSAGCTSEVGIDLGDTAESLPRCNPRHSDCPPSIAISSPTAGAVVSGTITVRGTASDDRGVARVEIGTG